MAFFGLTVNVTAQAESIPILELTPGEVITLVYTTKMTKGGVTNVGTTTVDVDVSTLTESGFEGVFKTRSVETAGTVIDKDHPMAKQLMVGFPINFQAETDLNPFSITNAAALTEKAIAALRLSAPSFSEDAVSSVRKNFNAMTEDALAKTYLEPLTLVAICHNVGITPGTGVTNDGEVQVYPDAPPVIQTVTYNVDVKQDNAFTIRYRSEFNEESLETAVRTFMTMSGIVGKNIEDLKVNRTDKMTCTVDAETGRVRDAEFLTKISSYGENIHKEISFKLR